MRPPGYRAFEAELHRARGEILLKRDPANPAPAEEALLTAIAVAKQQATRSFELRAALSLAKLYRSTGRPAEAHAVLAPALEDWPRSSLLPFGRRAGDEGPAGPATARKPSPLTPLPNGRGERSPPKCPRWPRRRRCWRRWLSRNDPGIEIPGEPRARARTNPVQGSPVPAVPSAGRRP